MSDPRGGESGEEEDDARVRRPAADGVDAGDGGGGTESRRVRTPSHGSRVIYHSLSRRVVTRSRRRRARPLAGRGARFRLCANDVPSSSPTASPPGRSRRPRRFLRSAPSASLAHAAMTRRYMAAMPTYVARRTRCLTSGATSKMTPKRPRPMPVPLQNAVVPRTRSTHVAWLGERPRRRCTRGADAAGEREHDAFLPVGVVHRAPQAAHRPSPPAASPPSRSPTPRASRRFFPSGATSRESDAPNERGGAEGRRDGEGVEEDAR